MSTNKPDALAEQPSVPQKTEIGPRDKTQSTTSGGSTCCPPAEQASCFAPSEKASCCGTASSANCGCK